MIHWVALTLLNGIGSVRARKLLEIYGTPEQIFLGRDNTKGIPGAIFNCLNLDVLSKAEKIVQWCVDHEVHLLTLGSPEYPPLLREIYDAPLVLYCQGLVASLQKPFVSIVGMRDPDRYGIDVAKELSTGLVQKGYSIVSGLAYGIDVAAQTAALDCGGETVAVMATGIDIIYPTAHRGLARKIIEQGALITEYPPGTQGKRHHFIQRNRLISGLAHGVVVVSAREKSGALATADFSIEQGRDLFAVPGSIFSDYSRGPNKLLESSAAPALSADQIVRYLKGTQTVEVGKIFSQEKPEVKIPVFPPLSDVESVICAQLSAVPVSVTALHDVTGLDLSVLFESLFDLEMSGLILSAPGNCYVLVP